METSINSTNRPPYGILAVLMAGAFVAILNSTFLNIALPSIMADLEVTPTTVQWLTTGYMLVNGIVIPTTAFFIQKYSVRQLFLTAISLFTIGTIIGGVAHIFPILLAARMIQAIGSAIMMPLLMNVLLTSFPVEKRGGAMGIFGLVMTFAPAIGPTLSGWIVEHFDWRMLFHIITPIALTVLVVSFFLLKDKKEKSSITIDTLSVLLSSIGFGGLLYGFSIAGEQGWRSPQVYGTILLGVICLVLFIVRQLKLEIPMLEFRIFKYPLFTLSAVISIALNITLFSGMILMPIYVQTIRGFSPLDSGILLLPGAIIMGIMSPITGRLFDKYGVRSLGIIGFGLTAITTYLFSNLTMDTSYTQLLIIYAFRSLGIALVMMPIMTNGLNQLPAKYNPHGTALNNTLSQVSGAIGSALLITVMSTRTATYAEEMTATEMGKLTEQPSTAMLAELQNKAMIEGINDAFLVSVGIVCIALILTFFAKRATPAEDFNKSQAKAS